MRRVRLRRRRRTIVRRCGRLSRRRWTIRGVCNAEVSNDAGNEKVKVKRISRVRTEIEPTTGGAAIALASRGATCIFAMVLRERTA
eukprot:6183820-Pleurochrysis_carterae.AAC.2